MRRKRSENELLALANEQIAIEYFRRIGEKDVSGLLDLFAEDAVVYEPFSNLNGLQGKSLIGHFLKVAVMANSGMQRTIQFIEKTADSITAMVTFERGDTIRGKFAFTFITNGEGASRRIRTLRIQFI